MLRPLRFTNLVAQSKALQGELVKIGLTVKSAALSVHWFSIPIFTISLLNSAINAIDSELKRSSIFKHLQIIAFKISSFT